MKYLIPLLATSLIAFSGCTAPKSDVNMGDTKPHIIVLDARLSDLVDPDAKWEVLSDGYQWAEGPTWDRERSQLYFTDVPGNKAYLWKDGVGTRVFLDPSGSSATQGFREPGANGLFYTSDDQLLLANHGERALQIIDLDDKSRSTLIDKFENKRFNSPNDLVQDSHGNIYLSDPPYGLAGLNDSELKELDFNGVYRLSTDGSLTLLTDSMTFPNGVSLSLDETRLYVAQSDPDAAGVFVIDSVNTVPSEPKLFFDMQNYVGGDHPGLPDGFARAASGDVIVTGPGGVFILSDRGQLLGRIMTGSATANVTFGGDDGRTLFITAQDRLLRLPMRVQGAAWVKKIKD